MNRWKVARDCLEIERAGGDVIGYLKEQGCISPRGTWYRLQREELHRGNSKLTEGRPEKMDCKRFGSRMDMLNAVIESIENKQDPFVMLFERGYKSPGQSYIDVKAYAKKNCPDLFEKLPANLGVWKRENGIGKDREKKLNELKQIRFGKLVREPAADPEGEEEKRRNEAQAEANAKARAEAEKTKITSPVMYQNMTVAAVSGVYGRYTRYTTSEGDYIDFECVQQDTIISLTVEQWRELLKELKLAAQILGVELDE